MNRENRDEAPLPGSDDRQVFEAFFDAHRRGVERFVQTRMATNQADVEDVCADVFIVAWRRFGEVRAEPELGARRWLLRVAELRSNTHRRSGLRRDRMFGRVALEPIADDLLEELFVNDLHRRSEAAERVESVLAHLRSQYVEVLRLDMSSDLSGEQMAVKLGVSHVAVRVRLTRARHAFRAEYIRQFGEPRRRAEDGSL